MPVKCCRVGLWLSVHLHTLLILVSSAWLALCSGQAKLLTLLAPVFAPLSSAGFSSDGWLYPFLLNEISLTLLLRVRAPVVSGFSLP